MILKKDTEQSKFVPSLRTWHPFYRRSYCMEFPLRGIFLNKNLGVEGHVI